ncbi:MAG: hypothetical protein CMF22_11630 [Idiomarinaceae bacterium]|nr:hypothetical protein [Idiomarinaceae bacterium]
MLSYWRELTKPDRIYKLVTSGFIVTRVAGVYNLQGVEQCTNLAPTFVLGRILRSADSDLRMITGICYTDPYGDVRLGELANQELIDAALNFMSNMDDAERDLFITPMRFHEIQAIIRL